MRRSTKKQLLTKTAEAEHWKRWCEEAEAERDRLMDGMESAWGIIANANGGDWAGESDKWREAAERWRDDQWHAALHRMSGFRSDEEGA